MYEACLLTTSSPAPFFLKLCERAEMFSRLCGRRVAGGGRGVHVLPVHDEEDETRFFQKK